MLCVRGGGGGGGRGAGRRGRGGGRGPRRRSGGGRTGSPREAGGGKVPVSWSLEVAELEARGLRAADSTGTSDPYVVFGGPACLCEAAGEPVLKTLNPR